MFAAKPLVGDYDMWNMPSPPASGANWQIMGPTIKIKPPSTGKKQSENSKNRCLNNQADRLLAFGG
jgi:hypothetical protein